MNLKGTKTEENLKAALAGESIARNKYSYYAMHAKENGEKEAAELFERLAINEMMHARAWYEFLNKKNDSVKDDVKDAAFGEYTEWHSMYPEFAATAREEGFDDVAAMFDRVAGIECDHEMQFMTLYSKMVSEKDAPVVQQQEEKAVRTETVHGYRCSFCGAAYEERPDVCQMCKAIGSFQACTFTRQV